MSQNHAVPDPENLGPRIFNKIKNREDLYLVKVHEGRIPEAEVIYPTGVDLSVSPESIPIWKDGLVYTSNQSRDYDPKALGKHLLEHSDEEGFCIELE